MKKAQVHPQMCNVKVEMRDDKDELGYVYQQNPRDLNWKTCLLIDSKSSIGIFNNLKILTKIHQARKPLKLCCNAGHIHVTQKGWFGEIKVWHHPNGIANILSLKTLKKRHHVTYDSRDRDGVLKVHTKKHVEGAIKAHHLQAMLGHPSMKVFKVMVCDNPIANCPTTPENISHAHQLFGENLAGLRGKQFTENQSEW